MPQQDLVTAVIPAYNPTALVEETIASIQNQTHSHKEIILVDDGSDKPESLRLIEKIENRGTPHLRVVHQQNLGLAGARNTGFLHARGEYVVPIDADDLLEPEMMETCLNRLESQPERGFCYFDYRVFGDFNHIERPGEYNLYRLLQENFMACCIFVKRAVWEQIGGYDEWHRWGYEDWSFFLNLGKNGFRGCYVQQPLFCYRTHGRGLHYLGLERHQTNWAHMTEQHPEVLSPEGKLRVKREWAPSLCFLVHGNRAPSLANQTVRDFQVLLNADEASALARSPAPAFLWLSGDRELRPQAAEECVWGLSEADWVTWNDTGDAPPPSLKQFAGPIGVSRRAMGWGEPKPSGVVRRLPWRCRVSGREGNAVHAGARRAGAFLPVQPAGASPASDAPVGDSPSTPDASHLSGRLGRLRHHLENAELLSADAWLKHPLRSSTRMLPLRWKERVNEVAGRPVFDLAFYLKFQPRSVLLDGQLIERLDYIPPAREPGRRRIALFTPHLGIGGAENVLLEFAGQIDRSRYEVFLVATQSSDSRLLLEWRERADWIFDAARLIPSERTSRLLYSLAINWELDVLVIQNSAAAYSILPALEQKHPECRVIDVLHAVDEDWDFFSATLDVSDHLDRRVVISEAGKKRLEEMATPLERIRLIRNGVDLARFHPDLFERGRLHRRLGLDPATRIILFAGRLDPVKRPLLLPRVARELERMRGKLPGFHFVVAGDGPEAARLRSAVHSSGLGKKFSLLGHVADIAELLADSEVLLIASRGEGIPLVLLEALAMQVPVVACRAGAIEEALSADCGVVVEPGTYEETRLAEALAKLMAEPAVRAAMGRAGRRLIAESYSSVQARELYRALLDELGEQPNTDTSAHATITGQGNPL